MKDANDNNRKLQATCPNGYKVIRVNIMFDSSLCLEYGGTRQAAIDRINLMIADFKDAYEDICITVQTCGVSGYCDPNDDPLQDQVVRPATGFCLQSETSVLDIFREYTFPNGQSHYDKYGSDTCDVTHLIFGKVNGVARFPGHAIGCSFRRSACTDHGVAINQLGEFGYSLADQGATVALN